MRTLRKIKPDYWILIILVVLGLVFFTIQLGKWNNFIYRPGSKYSDLTITFWPNIYFIQQSIKNFHQIPLWRTLIFSGSPFDSDPQSGLWYPLNLIFLFLPASLGFNLLFLIHFLIAGIGMWFWARNVGISHIGGIIAALAFSFTPKIFAHLGFGHIGLYYAAAYIPWILWAAYKTATGFRKYIYLMGIMFGLQIISNPQLAVYTGLASWLYGIIYGFLSSRENGTLKKFLLPVYRLAVGSCLALSISAVQWVPMMRFAAMSGRQGMSLEETAISSLPYRYMAGLLIADHTGYMEYMLYIGIPALLLACFAFFGHQGKFWWGFFFVSLIYSLGVNTQFYRFIFGIFPPLAWFRSPARSMFIPIAGLLLLAGFGFDRLFAEFKLKPRKYINIVLFSCGLFAFLLLAGYWFIFGKPAENLLAFGLIVPICTLVVGLCINKKIGQIIAGVLIGLILLIDLWIVDGTLVEGRQQDAVFEESGLGAYLASLSKDSVFRVYSPSYSIPRQIGAYDHIENADGVDPLYLASYDQFMQAASGVKRRNYEVTIPAMEGDGDISTINHTAIMDLNLLGMLNVCYIAAGFPIEQKGLVQAGQFDTTYLYKNEFCHPRAYFATQVIAVNNLSEAIRQLQFSKNIQLSTIETKRNMVSGMPEKYSILWKKNTPNEIVLDVFTDRLSILILSQIYYPDWKAEVDRQAVPLYKTNGVVSGISLNMGQHTVRLIYHPVITYICLCVSIVMVIYSLIGGLEVSKKKPEL